jgi:hypothetical protein
MADTDKSCTWRKFCKLTNVLSGISLTGLGVLKFFSLFSLNIGIDTIVFPIFFVIFGLMMLAGDLDIKIITENFKFLGNFFGRGLFSFYVGSSLSLVFGNDMNLINWILFFGGIALMIWGLMLIIAGFMGKWGLGSDIIAESESYVAKGYKVQAKETA